MTTYLPHFGRFYFQSNYEQGGIDFAIIANSDCIGSVIVLKYNNQVAVYSLSELKFLKDKANCLLSKDCLSDEEAYEKFMKIIGKMIKKGKTREGHVSRYFANLTHNMYVSPQFLSDKEIMEPVYFFIEAFGHEFMY